MMGAALAALAIGVPAGVDAQETNEAAPVTVGPAELRNFQLPGRRVTPPPVEPQPTVTTPPPTAAEPDPAPRTTAPPVERAPQRREAPAAAARAPTATPTVAAPPPVAAMETPLPEAAVPALPDPVADAEPALAAPAEGGSNWAGWLAILAGILVAAGGFFALRSRRREPELAAAGARSARALAQPAPAPSARPVPDPPTRLAQREPRPWLELSFKPARAAATDNGAVLHYELVVRNVGQSAARNVRIDARMFNAGADQDREIGAFFSASGEERNSGPLSMIMPGGQVPVRSTLTMPKEHVREYKVQGRSLFIPMVAFNVVYDWGDGRVGKTSMSYLVGQEAPTPSEKMGAFRLDLGPRIYRSIGQRQHKLAEMV